MTKIERAARLAAVWDALERGSDKLPLELGLPGHLILQETEWLEQAGFYPPDSLKQGFLGEKADPGYTPLTDADASLEWLVLATKRVLDASTSLRKAAASVGTESGGD